MEEPPAPGSPDLSLFSLFPTVEEQIENIAQAQVDEQQAAQQQTSLPAGQVPDAVVGRALTSGGNEAHSIERIVAFFQKGPTGSAAASFMEKEFGEGGKGVTIAGQDYALWFGKEGFRIAPGRSAFGPGSTLVSWVNAAVMVSKLLRDGIFAAQDKIDAAPDNEVRELAEKLWYLRQDFSDSAREQNLLPTISQHFFGKGFPNDTKEIAELLKTPVHRQQIMWELAVFADEHAKSPDLLRFRHHPVPRELLEQVAGLFTPREQFQSVEDFAPAKASFITEDEITRLLAGGPNISESKLQIYSYFVQGHNAKECAQFLKESYGEGGYGRQGYNENHGTKGISLTREDEESGYKGYDTVTLNWNQVQKRVRALIDSGQYLNDQEKAYLPAYEKVTLARKIYHFYSMDPNRTNPPGNDMDAAVKKFRAMLDNPEQCKELFGDMAKIFAVVPLDSRENQRMEPILTDMTAFRRGEYSLFTPLPEAVLEAERQKKQAEKEARRKDPEPQRTTSEAPPASGDRLAAAAHALAKKRPAAAQEDQSGQFSLFSTATPAPLEPEAPAPALEPAAPPQEAEHEETSRSPWWDGYHEIKEANPNNIVMFQVGDFYEMFGEDAKTAAALLDLNLTTRPIAGVGRVEMCGIPVHAVEQSVEKLREFHSVTLAPVEAQTGERQPRTLLSQQEQAIQDSGEQGWNTTVTERNYQATVIEAEAPLLARLMQSNGISAAQFVHDNGDVTFSFPASDRDAVEKLIARLRAIINKAVADSYPSAKGNKPGRTKVELNYRTFAKLFPEIASGEYRYLRMEAGEAGGGMMPLHLQWIDTDVVAVSHTYTVNGDTLYDPEMTFRVDREKGTLEPLTFQQDGSIQIYQEVYPEPGRWIPKLRRDLNTFAQQWMNNISQQRYQKREAVMVRDGEDVRLTFDQDGKAVGPTPAPAAENALGDHPTIKEIYGHYAPVVKNLVLEDAAYRNACANSNQDLAHLEGSEAIKRAVLSINDTVLLKQYYDNTAFHNRLHQDIISETYPMLSQLQQEQAAENGNNPAEASYGSEFMYRRLSVLKSDCDYFLGAGGRNEKHLSEGGSIEKQIAKMRELYDAVSQKPEWLTVEDIDRYEQRMTAPEQGIEWAVSPVTLYRDLLEMTDREINRGGWLYERLRDRSNDYNTAKEALETELYAYVKHVANGYSDIMAAYHTLPKFREWLIEDLMERNYQDVSFDQRDAPDRHSHDADAPEWAKDAPPTPKPQYVIWSAKGPIKRPEPVPQAQEPAQPAPAADHSEPEQPEAGAGIPPTPETVPEPTGADMLEQVERADAAPVEPDLTPNVDEYLNLKAQHPDKLIGVQVGGYTLFYGKDAEAAAPAMGKKLLTREIPGLGSTFVTGTSLGWQSALRELLEHGHSVVMARPDPERGPGAPYEIIKERSTAEYIPLGMELTIDGRRMKIDSVDFQAGTVSLLDLDMKGWFPIFRSEPIPFVREFIEEVERSEEYMAAEMAAQLQRQETADEIPIGMELTVDGQRVKIDSIDVEHDVVRLKILDLAYSYLQRPIQVVRDLVAKARAAVLGTAEPVRPPEPERQEDSQEPDRSAADTASILPGHGTADTIPIGAVLTIDGHRMKIDSVDKAGNDVMLLDLDAKGGPPMFIVRPTAYVRRQVAEAQAADARKEPEIPVPTPTPEPEQVEIDGGQIIPAPTPRQPRQERHNFQITDDNLGAGGEKTKYQYNVTAIRTLKQIEAEGRLATPEEQEILSRYVGWGGIAGAFDQKDPKWTKEYAELKELLTPEEYDSARSTVLNAHYTSPTVIKAMYQAVENMNFQPGTVLEPSMGIGNFFGLLPEKLAAAKLYGVELDDLTGRIARQLYQKADITLAGFEKTDRKDFYDLAVGNVPFGQYHVNDPAYNKLGFNIHNYFFAKALDQVRPGGIVAFVTSRYTMDAKDSTVRK